MNEILFHHRKCVTVMRLVSLCVLLWLLFDLPAHPDAIVPANFLRIPVEIPALVFLLVFLGGGTRKALIFLVTLCAAVLLFLKIADICTQAAFQRPFNPYLDMKMIRDGWNVLSGSIGTFEAALAVVSMLLAFASFAIILRWSANFASGLSERKRTGVTLFTMASLVAFLALLPVQKKIAWSGALRIAASTLPSILDRLTLIAHSISDMRQFETELAAGNKVPMRPNLFGKIAGRDVFLIFIESYGQSAVEDARYAPIIQPRLRAMQEELSTAGYYSASRWITSPTVGGLSWLAHGTLLSGLWVDSQARYDRLVRSERSTLNSLFRKAGWETVAAMPAITMEWPEASYFGYDKVFAAKDLGYQGKPFNWVTMPDQFTLLAIDRLARRTNDRKPVMIETALISSHAPWTPVPSILPWNEIGDGRIFDAQAKAGPSPAEVWSNSEDVRIHYIRTIDYSLQTIGSYIATYGTGALFIVIGDHQPAAIVTGPEASRAVPLHIISEDQSVIDAFQHEGFAEGLLPSPERAIPMNELRDLLIDLL